jgi:hypothetical protein
MFYPHYKQGDHEVTSWYPEERFPKIKHCNWTSKLMSTETVSIHRSVDAGGKLIHYISKSIVKQHW